MRINMLGGKTYVLAASMLSVACAKRPQTEIPAPTPTSSAPVIPVPIPVPGKTILRDRTTPASSGPWTFAYTPATLTYEIFIEGTVALLPDSTHLRALGSTTQRVTIAIAADGTVQLVDPPQPSSAVCDSTAILASRALQLLPRLPSQLSANFTWSDSTTVDNCVGNTFANTTLTHTYTVIGDTTLNGINALHIVRSSVISAKGEGSEGQHRVLLSTSGVGTTDLYFDVTGGRFLGSLGVQMSTLDVTTSGQLSHFLQHATERVTLVRTP